MLANAKIDLERYERLAATNAINRQQADTQKALVAQNAALVQADQAAIDNAQAMLGYTTIVAPIDGRTGIRQVDEGNIVHASDATGIVVITQLKPISVLFNLPQQDLGQVNSAFAKGPLAVEAQRSDNDAVIDRGTLRVVDNQVDQTTGTVKLKAEFPNADLQLWPGQFVNVRLLIDTLQAGRGDPDRRGAARPERHLRLRGQGRQHRGDAPDHGAEAGRDADRGQRAASSRPSAWSPPASPGSPTAARLRSAAPTAPAAGRGRAAAARPARRRSGSAGGSTARPNRAAMSVSSPIHSPADRHLPARRRGDAGRRARLLVAAGLGAAAGGFPDHPGHHPAARRQSRHHRRAGDRAAGAAVRPDPGAADHDLVELVRHQPGHAAIRSQPRHRRRRAGRAVGDQCRRLDAAAQPALSAALFQGEPGRRADHHAGAHLATPSTCARSATWPTPSWRRGCPR